MALLALAVIATSHADESLQDAESAPLDEVIVTGMRAGPRMWKVSNGEHVLWVLGVLDPLPKQMQWQSQEVAAVIAESQAVLLDNLKVSADVGLFAKLGLYLRWESLQRNPRNKRLQNVLSPELYARFNTLKKRYAPRDKLDDLRPILAAAQLYRAAIEEIGLGSRRVVSRQVEKLAKQHGIKPQRVELTVTKPRELLDSLGALDTNAEIRCLAATVARLESDLAVLRERANAWALGDVAALRVMVDSENRAACWDVITSVPRVKELAATAEQDWFAAADAALQRHASSLVLRPIRELIMPNGVLEQFRAKGYQVIGP